MNEPKEMEKVQALYKKFSENQFALVKQIAERQFDSQKKSKPIISPEPGDKRFKAKEWDEAPYFFDFIKQNYLLVSQLMNEIVENVETDYHTKRKLKFYTKQQINALSPSNFALTNPEVLNLVKETNGKSLVDGFNNFLEDFQKGKISQTDETAFEVGKDIACTPGSVIFENDLMQLIQYTPTTAKVYEIPLLIVPANINKYYLMDMQPANSLVKFVVAEGMSTFMVSWKSGSADSKDVIFDDYIEKGIFTAIEIVKEVNKDTGYLDRILSKDLIYIIRDKKENEISLNEKFKNIPDIMIDDFTENKIIKSMIVGTSSLDDKILFEFSFNNIDKKDYIVFSYITGDLKLCKFKL